MGAGISGPGAAHPPQRDRPNTATPSWRPAPPWAARGTCSASLLRGVRSDSDPHTLGHEFRPRRREHASAGAAEILGHRRDTAAECGIDCRIRVRSRVPGTRWSSPQARWNAAVEHTDTGERTVLTCATGCAARAATTAATRAAPRTLRDGTASQAPAGAAAHVTVLQHPPTSCRWPPGSAAPGSAP
ncbi:hypothetical protein GCM10022630_31330 [Thermobifida alba]